MKSLSSKLFFLLVLFAVEIINAQTQGEITGTVTDSQNSNYVEANIIAFDDIW